MGETAGESKRRSETEIALALSMQELYDSFCANRSLQHLIDKSYELFGRPIVIFDMAGKVLAKSERTDEWFHFSDEQNGVFFLGEDTVALIRANASAGKLLFSTVAIDAIEIAQLAVSWADVPFTEYDHLLMEKLSALLSAQLQRSILLDLDHNFRPTYILADLVEGKPIDETIANSRVRHLKWANAESLCILVISGGGYELFDEKISAIFRALKTYISVQQCIVYHCAIVAFVDQVLYETLFGEPNTAFTGFVKKNKLHVGISLKYRHLSESRKQYLNALKALEIGQRQNIPCCFFEDCSLIIITEMISSRYDMMDLCHPAVSMLVSYDKENGTNLLDTLKQYLFYASAPNEAAKKLNIHRNTLFYRIGKIKEMTGITLEHGDEICKIYMSIRFLEANRLYKNP
ncbi:MAG: helix-turn-helix domain-containing protein [Clostridiales bacterium]|jgi:hypothetical protein|nr:helix-turn-helix domain-containing protein [Clostridiales bacterium]